MNNTETNNLEKENEELKAQIRALSTLNPALYTGVVDDSDEIDLKELWNAIWAGKWIIASISSMFSIVAIVVALWLPNQYKSTALLAPASTSSSSQLGKLAGQFGGLASLAGINLGSGGADDKTVIAIEIMKTWGFLEKFIKDNNIEAEVFAANGWNRATGKLKYDKDLFDTEKKVWVRDFESSKGETAEPSSWELYEEFKEHFSVSQDKENGIVSVSYEHYSPMLAKYWVDEIVKEINRHISEQDKKEAANSIEFLEEQIENTSVTHMQTVFYQLIEEQTKTLLLAEVNDEYVMKTISPAKIAEEKSSPKRAIIVILSTLLGMLFSVVFVVIRAFSRKESV